jgi:transposase
MMKHHSNYNGGEVSERYGPYTTAYNRFNRWRKAGVWNRLMDVVTKAHGGEVQMIDSSIVRVHQHASGVKKRAEIAVRAKPRRESNHGGPGRTRTSNQAVMSR